MKRLTLIFALVAIMFTTNSCFSQYKVDWMHVNDAIAQAQKDGKNAKMIFVDCYTSWCGWCKVLDSKTFSNDTIAAILNYYYYPCKFDAEGGEIIKINDETFLGTKKGNKNGTHELMKVFWEGQRGGGYPTMVIRKSDFSPMDIEMGYLPAQDLEPILVYYAGGFNKKISIDKFKNNYKKEYQKDILNKVFKH